MITFVNSVVWGVQPIKPIVNAPAGKQRIRMRNRDCARLFVRDGDSIRHFILEDCGDFWRVNPSLEQGANYRK